MRVPVFLRLAAAWPRQTLLDSSDKAIYSALPSLSPNTANIYRQSRYIHSSEPITRGLSCNLLAPIWCYLSLALSLCISPPSAHRSGIERPAEDRDAAPNRGQNSSTRVKIYTWTNCCLSTLVLRRGTHHLHLVPTDAPLSRDNSRGCSSRPPRKRGLCQCSLKLEVFLPGGGCSTCGAVIQAIGSIGRGI